MPTNHIFRRKRYIVKIGLQFRYIGLVFMLAVLASLVTGYTVFATGWTFLGEKLANVYPQGRLIYILRATNIALLRNLLLISPIIFIIGLLFSHKIAGPVYRIEKSLDEIAKGNLLMKIKLRQGDELTDLAEMINIMTENVNKTISTSKISSLEIQNNINEIKKRISSQPCDLIRIESLILNLQTKLSELDSCLDKWNTA